MGKIRTIKDNELSGGTTNDPIYPVTSDKAVYNSNNEKLKDVLARNLPNNVSMNYNSGHIVEVLTLTTALNKVPNTDRSIGQAINFYDGTRWRGFQFTGTDITSWLTESNWVSTINVDSGGGTTTGYNIVLLADEAAYDALAIKDPNTLYAW